MVQWFRVHPLMWRRRRWHPTPVLLLGKSRGQRSLASYTPGGSRRVGHDLVTKQQHNKSVISSVNRFPWVLWAVLAITQTQRETHGNFWFVFSHSEAHVTTWACCCHIMWWDCGNWFYLWVDSVRTELNHWTSSWCLRTAAWYEEAFSWQNSVSLCPASFCSPRPNLLVTPGRVLAPHKVILTLTMLFISPWGTPC